MKDIETKIEELLSQMTLKEKIGQLNQIQAPLSPDETIFQMLREGKIGSFIMANTAHAGNDAADHATAELLHELQRVAVEESRLGIPIIYGRDVIHGHNTVLPIPLAMAASFDDELIKTCYRQVAEEAAHDGVQWTFTPMLDTSRDPRWGRCIESAGEDPYRASGMARAVVEGFQGDDLAAEDSIAACAKHYIGYGASEGGRDYHRTEISDYTLRNYYLPPFRAAVESGVQTVMSSFNEISGQPVSSSRYLMYDVLKKELGFDGFIISDWHAILQLIRQGVACDEKHAAELAINAGLDMDMVDKCYIHHLEELVETGRVDIATIDESVRRVLRVKFRLGLFEKPYIPEYRIDYAAHAASARALAAASMVLLKNKDHILPLSTDTKVALVGDMAEDRENLLGSWCLDGRPEDVTDIRKGMAEYLPAGKLLFTASHQADDQIIACASADVAVVCIGESRKVTGEANSVARIEVGDRELDLVKRVKQAGKRVIAVLCYGRPVALEALEPYCDAMLYAWHAGTEAGGAVADILFGKINPSAKLPMTMPRATGQIPIYYNASSPARYVNGYYDHIPYGVVYHDCDSSPMYPFGYGLGYANFEMSNIAVDRSEITEQELEDGDAFAVTLTLKNTSDIAGCEVVQLYIRDTVASMTRSVRELKGYQKVFVPAGGETKVNFTLGYRELGFYNGQGNFTAEPGEFQIFIGNDCYAERAFTVNVK